MATKVQLIDGQFQDSAGNPLAGGYLEFELSQDGAVNGSVQVAAGSVLTAPLDSNGNINEASNFSLWPNDAITPANTFYNVSAYTEGGQLVWGPNAQQVFSTPNPYNIGVWVPGAVNTSENLEGILLQTDGVNNVSQIKLNLTAGTNITLVSDSSGNVTISSAGGGGSVTGIGVATANGLSGTSSGGSTPVLTLTADSTFARTNVGNTFSGSAGVQNFNGGITVQNGVVLPNGTLSTLTGTSTKAATQSTSQSTQPTSGHLTQWSNDASGSGYGLSDTGILSSNIPQLNTSNVFSGSSNTFTGGPIFGGGSVTGSLISRGSGVIIGIESTVPYLALVNSSPIANNRVWDWFVDNTGDLIGRAVLDDGSAGSSWIGVSRVGDSPSTITLNANVLMPSLSLTSAVFSTTAAAGSATLPATPAGFFEIATQSGSIKIPYYNV